MIGRLKHSIKERCPECGKVLQVRVQDVISMVKGVETSFPLEYICCSNYEVCVYERTLKQKRRRRQDLEDFQIT